MIVYRWLRWQWIIIVSQVLMWVTLIVTFFQFLGQFKLMNDSYHLGRVAIYVLCIIPRDLYRLFPISLALIAVIYLWRMFSKNLLTNWYVLTLQPRQVQQRLFLYFTCLICCAFLIGEVIAPVSEQMAKKMRLEWLSQHQISGGIQDIWIKEKSGFAHAFYAKDMKTLLDVQRFSFEKGQLQKYEYAKRAVFQQGTWYLENLKAFQLGHNSIKILPSPINYQWSVDLSPDLLALSQVKPEHRSIFSFSKLFMIGDLYGLFYHSDKALLVARLFNPLVLLLLIWFSLSQQLPITSQKEFMRKRMDFLGLMLILLLWNYSSFNVLNFFNSQFPVLLYIVFTGLLCMLWMFLPQLKRLGVYWRFYDKKDI